MIQHTVTELRAIAASLNLVIPSRILKADLIARIETAQELNTVVKLLKVPGMFSPEGIMIRQGTTVRQFLINHGCHIDTPRYTLPEKYAIRIGREDDGDTMYSVARSTAGRPLTGHDLDEYVLTNGDIITCHPIF